MSPAAPASNPTRRQVSTGYVPHRHQLEIHRGLRRFSVLVCHRRFGKTILAVNTLIDGALRVGDGRFAYVAPYLKQARQIAWDILIRHTATIPGCKTNRTENCITFPNGAKVTLFGSDNGEAMRGLGFHGVVGDELADFRPETWPEVIRPALSDHKGWALFIGTPKGMNQFHELYQRALTDAKWYAGMYRADETDLPWLDGEEIEDSRSMMSASQFRQEWLCDFSASTDDVLITIDQVTAACNRAALSEQDLTGAARVIGVDVARFGDDRSVIQKRWGRLALEPTVFDNIDNMQLAGHVARQIHEWRPDAVFIDGGRGEGVIDRLRQLGHSVIEVHFGGTPLNPHYANKRAEMWDGVADWIRHGGILPQHKDLKTDLCVPTYRFNRANRFDLESKDDIKKRGMRSPDMGDALALTFAMPVAPHVSPRPGSRPANIVTDHTDYFAES